MATNCYIGFNLSAANTKRTCCCKELMSTNIFYYFICFTGVITLPMTFITNTPIECTIHQDLWFSDTFTLPNKSVISSPEFSLASGSQGKASVVSCNIFSAYNAVLQNIYCFNNAYQNINISFSTVYVFNLYLSGNTETLGNVLTKLFEKILYRDSCFTISSLLFVLSISSASYSDLYRKNICQVILFTLRK